MHDERRILRFVVALLGVVVAARGACADDYAFQPGIDVLKYSYEITLSDQDDAIHGLAEITVRFRDRDISSVEFDLVRRPGDEAPGMTVETVHLGGGAKIPFVHADDRISIDLSPSTPAAGEDRTFHIKYHGIPADGLIISNNSHGKRTFFADNFPNRARHWLPSIDHPSDKAEVSFRINAPSHYEIIANGRLLEQQAPGTDDVVHSWKTEAPIATYLMVIGVADFVVREEAPFMGIPVSTWVFEDDAEAGLDDFSITHDALRFFVQHVGPYPYAKLANVQSRTRYGGMENASCIFYNERTVAGDRDFDNTIVHEIAHQWFGNSVTESDWNHIWLSEGFATYFTHLYNEHTFGRERMVDGLQRDRERIIRYENRNPGTAVVDEDVPIDGILSTLTYQKGSWVLHMLRRQIGDDAFWRGIRVYYAKYRDANTLTDELRTVMEDVSGQDLTWFFDQWIYSPGHPVLDVDWTCLEGEDTLVLRVIQVQDEPRSFRFPLDIEIRNASGEALHVAREEITEREAEFTYSVSGGPALIQLDPHTNLLFERADAIDE